MDDALIDKNKSITWPHIKRKLSLEIMGKLVIVIKSAIIFTQVLLFVVNLTV